MEKNNGLKFLFVFIIFVVIIVGGFILMKNSNKIIKIDTSKKTTKKEEYEDIRLDKSKDYIYFTNEESLEKELQITYEDININFNTDSDVEKKQNDETAKMKKNVKYNKTEDDDEEEKKAYNNLKKADYKMYKVYNYDKYISLVADYFTYTDDELVSYNKTKAYVFSKKDGKEISKKELLDTYKLDMDKVREKVRDHVEGEGKLKENETVYPRDTADNISEDGLYVNKLGKLVISVLVKSDQKDYNDVILLS